MQIASITTNGQGEYEYATEEDYLEQTLDIIIQKEGFERKNISYEIDKAEIMSDILLNELEKGTKEKTRIFGAIRNSKNRDPVKASSITLSIEGTQIATITSNELGGYEYTAEEDYIGQTLDYVIQKEGFIRQDISQEIDRFEIESDFLIDEIEIEIEIKGKICDKADRPLADASISFRIGDKTITLTSDEDGSFSFTASQQFLNQTIGYEASKEGFKVKSGKLELIEDLKCINLDPIPVPFWNKNKVAVVSIALIGLAIVAYVILQGGPELAIDQDPFNFDFEPETSAQTFSIWNDGDGTLEWYVDSDPDWIMVSRDTGTDSGTVTVSVNSAGMDPGRHTGIITVTSNGGTETGRISLIIPGIEEPTVEPTLDAPVIHDFSAEPKHIDGPEGETTLSWEVSGATRVTINGIPVKVPAGSIERVVGENTLFTLMATNDAGVSDVRDTKVYVGVIPSDLPIIDSFYANTTVISAGSASTLYWEVSGATKVTIDEKGVDPVGGNTVVYPDITTPYKLTATNEAGEADSTVTVTVIEAESGGEGIVEEQAEPIEDKPEILYFFTNPEIISSGEKTTLQWYVSGVETVTIDNGIGEIGGIGNTDVFLDETTIFILTAENDAGKDAKPVTVKVLQPVLSVSPTPLSLDFEIKPFIAGTVHRTFIDNTKTFTISNSGEGNLHWSINAYDMSIYNWKWITVDPTEGVLKANNEETITIKINTAELKSGDYKGRIFIDSNGGTFNGDISLDFEKFDIVKPTLVAPTYVKIK